MCNTLIAGACSYVFLLLIVAHPFFDITTPAYKMDAQEITNWLTAGLAVATVWLGAETRRMAVAAKASIALETMPYLSLRGFFINIGTLQDLSTQKSGAFRLALRLSNPGKVLVTYQVESMLVSINGAEVGTSHIGTSRLVVHPSEEMLYFYPIIATTAPVKAPATLEVTYRIRYWAIPAETKTLAAKVNVFLTSETAHEWNYLDGPNYA